MCNECKDFSKKDACNLNRFLLFHIKAIYWSLCVKSQYLVVHILLVSMHWDILIYRLQVLPFHNNQWFFCQLKTQINTFSFVQMSLEISSCPKWLYLYMCKDQILHLKDNKKIYMGQHSSFAVHFQKYGTNWLVLICFICDVIWYKCSFYPLSNFSFSQHSLNETDDFWHISAKLSK